MKYLVEMKLADSGRSTNPQDGAVFIERYILPSLAACKELEAAGKILAGGAVAGAIALALIVEAKSRQELDELLAGLPIWPRMETSVVPLTTFDGRMAAVRPRLERLKSILQSKTQV